MHHNPIKAMVVDDSAFMRQLISDVLRSDPGIEVVATASDPFQARDLIKQYNPDVLTLDVEMPKMDGLKFLENLMRLRPMPVVMVSSLTEAGAHELVLTLSADGETLKQARATITRIASCNAANSASPQKGRLMCTDCRFDQPCPLQPKMRSKVR